MISAIECALERIHATIPDEILSLAFEDYKYPDESLDYIIKKEVILNRVKRDASLRGGKVFDLVLDTSWSHQLESPSPYILGISGSYNAFVIPPEAREHRDIVAILSYHRTYLNSTNTLYGEFSTNGFTRGNTLQGLARLALDAQTRARMIPELHAELKSNNTIVITPLISSFNQWQHMLTVRLEYDDEFSGMEVSSIQPFSLLCEFAIKAYIWTRLSVKLDSNAVFRGAEVGIVKDIVSDYRDANEKYDEQLLQLGGAEMFDSSRQYRFLSALVPPV